MRKLNLVLLSGLFWLISCTFQHVRNQPFSAVRFEKNVGWIWGAVTYVSRDSGNSWTLCSQLLQPEDRLPDETRHVLSVVDENTCFASNSRGIVRSSDSGMNWVLVSEVWTFPLFFFSDGVGFAADPTGGMVRTEDGGQHWSKVTQAGRTRFEDVAQIGKAVYALRGWSLLVSGDNGLSWREVMKVQPATRMVRLGSELWFLGDRGVCKRWNPGTETIQDLWIATESRILDIASNGSTWIAGGTDGMLYVSRGKPGEWDRTRIGAGYWITGVTFSPDGRAFAVGGIGQSFFTRPARLVLVSKDYSTWLPIDLP